MCSGGVLFLEKNKHISPKLMWNLKIYRLGSDESPFEGGDVDVPAVSLQRCNHWLNTSHICQVPSIFC